MTDAEPAPSDGVEEQSVAAPPHVSTTRGPLTVEYCPNCSMPPEYCEFSACFADKCRPWLEKHHPELLSGVDLSAAVAQLALTDHKDDAKDPKNGPAADDKKAAKKKPKGPSTDSASDSGSSSGSDEESAPSKPRGSAAAAIRTKAPVSSGVLIRKEERTKRKFTTSVKGLDGFGLDLKKAAKAFSKKFACSASVVKVSEGGHEIQIQGDVQMELPDFIVHEFNQVPPAALFFLDKANKKTKCF